MDRLDVDWSGTVHHTPIRPSRRSVALRVAACWSIVLGALVIAFELLLVWIAYQLGTLFGCEVDCWLSAGTAIIPSLALPVAIFSLGGLAIAGGAGLWCRARWAAPVLTWVFGGVALLCLGGVVFHLTRPQFPAASGYLLLAALFAVPAGLVNSASARAERAQLDADAAARRLRATPIG